MSTPTSDDFGPRDWWTGGRRPPAPRRVGPGSHADTAHPTRARLLDAAVDLLVERRLEDVAVGDVTAAAGVAKGTFYVHFADRAQFESALRHRFHVELASDVDWSAGDLPPGAERLELRLCALLDACLHRVGLQALLWPTARDPVALDQARRRTEEESTVTAEDLWAMGTRAHPTGVARLVLAATAEVAAMEQEQGVALVDMRSALRTLVFGRGPGPRTAPLRRRR